MRRLWPRDHDNRSDRSPRHMAHFKFPPWLTYLSSGVSHSFPSMEVAVILHSWNGGLVREIRASQPVPPKEKRYSPEDRYLRHGGFGGVPSGAASCLAHCVLCARACLNLFVYLFLSFSLPYPRCMFACAVCQSFLNYRLSNYSLSALLHFRGFRL
jgi:hypothetical protein